MSLLFVYGTLMRGMHWHWLLSDSPQNLSTFIDKATLSSTEMYLLPNTENPIPVIVKSTSEENTVIGEVWELSNDIQNTLANFEEEAGYVAKIVSVCLQSGEILEVEAYFFVDEGDVKEWTKIPSGDFRAFISPEEK